MTNEELMKAVIGLTLENARKLSPGNRIRAAIIGNTQLPKPMDFDKTRLNIELINGKITKALFFG